MSDSKTATVYHPNMARVPVLTDGELTPGIVHDFESRCLIYFMNAKDTIANDLKVTKILDCFQNSLVNDWASTECKELAKLMFNKFMKELRERWLPTNWEQMVLTQMLGMHLDLTRHKFEPWAAQIMSHNIALKNMDSHMSDNALCKQLEIMLDEELCILARESNIATLTELRPWMSKIKELDTCHQVELKCMAHFFDVAST
jgi:hypothetical protein